MILCDWQWIRTVGNLPRKSNSRQAVENPRTGKPMFIKSAKALQWVQDALRQLAPLRVPLGSEQQPLSITMHIWYKDKRPDLSDELVLDMLKRALIISDDRHVYHVELFKHFNRDKQGIWFQIKEIEHDPYQDPDSF